ncbi:MAG: hypothetical protein JST91_15360 [Actinobacteria bacterium]|nr:hypothetical protein [Actinomycetota bacterium]
MGAVTGKFVVIADGVGAEVPRAGLTRRLRPPATPVTSAHTVSPDAR